MNAIAQAANQSQNGPQAAVGMCLKMVRTCYGVASQYPDATSAWLGAAHKHKTNVPTDIPAGAPVFWTGGSEHHGHIAISTGAGWCWSTDIKRRGYFDHVPIDEIRTKWGLTLVGWTNDLNGVTVYAPPVQKPEPPMVKPPVKPSNWAVVRGRILDVLNSSEAKSIPITRPMVRRFLAATRAGINKLPKS